jgi:glutathione S-transferase
MLLVGRDRSPFVRRTSTVLEFLKLPYERLTLATTDVDELKPFNPLVRVPALVLDGGETLIDSSAIIDYLLEAGDPSCRLLPAGGALRRHILRMSAFATGVMKKGVAAAYEMRQRPAELVHGPWLQQLKGQVRAGLAELEKMATGKQWLHGAEPGAARNVVGIRGAISSNVKLSDHAARSIG